LQLTLAEQLEVELDYPQDAIAFTLAKIKGERQTYAQQWLPHRYFLSPRLKLKAVHIERLKRVAASQQ